MSVSAKTALLGHDAVDLYQATAELVCSFDLNGRILEVNDAIEGTTGYSREELLGSNIRSLLDRDSWQRTRAQALGQLAEDTEQHIEIRMFAKSGQPLRIAARRRLLFENGQPAAVLSLGRVIGDADVLERVSAGSSSGPLAMPSPELARFAEHLRQLHRLSTVRWDSLEHAFEDHLRTGCRLLRMPAGMVLGVNDGCAVVRASFGSAALPAGSKLPLETTYCATTADRLRTLFFPEPRSLAVSPHFATYVGTPVLVDSEVFGTICFSSPHASPSRALTPAEKEVLELLARGLGRVLLEHSIHEERRKSEQLEKNRNRVLELVAENRSLESILAEIVRMVEAQRPQALCSVLLSSGDTLGWKAAPGFPPETIQRSKLIKAPLDGSDLAAAELSRSAVLWEDLRYCPIWAERSYFASQMGITACLSSPIQSGTGDFLGLVALHYRNADAAASEDRELLQCAGHLARIAIEQRRMSQHLEFRARHDSLTGLPNRFYFIELLEAALSRARELSGMVTVLFIDLDRFKQINDTLGHSMGDRLLKEVGARLRRLLTPDDLAGRVGGDEFTVALTRQPDPQIAIRSVAEFLTALRAPHRIDDSEMFVTASIGVAIFPEHGATAADLLRNADHAMYHAKNSGKDNLEFFLAEGSGSGLERLRLENALRRALDNCEFDLLYQPMVAVSGSLEGLEALLTWRHPVYGTISPKQFIPIAEEAGLIVPIGSWVIRQACLQGVRWQNAGYRPVRISVNVSALQFERRDFVETVAAALSFSGFPPELLQLELTESYVMRDLSQAAFRMSQIRDLGVSISIDDFGTGYSSLSYLNRLPVDSLKIDQSFLRSLQAPDGSLPVVQGIVRLAHGMNLTVVAEGVETIEELDLVRVLGCDLVQGHLYGRALSSQEAEALLARNDSGAQMSLQLGSAR